MTDYTFRLRFRVAGTRLDIPTPSWEFVFPGTGNVVRLVSHPDGTPIVEAKALVLKGGGWPDEASARCAGEHACRALALALAKLGVGADFGRPASGWHFSPAYIEAVSRERGDRVLADESGLMVFETSPPPRFLSGSASGYVGTPPEKLARLLPRAFAHARPLTPKEQLALDLYNAAFFEASVDARFLTLVTAVEVLLEPQPKSDAGRRHVEHLMDLTRTAADLAAGERASLLSTLGWMRSESISQTGRRMARTRLGDRQYHGMTPPEFYTHVYDIRSKKVHGAVPPPSNDAIGAIVHPLLMFVCDLVVGTALDLPDGNPGQTLD